MSNDLVTVIVPIYNIENYIEKCLLSLLNQTYEELEILLINDGTLDGSIDRIKNCIDDRCKIFHKINGGLSSARNYGLRYASGKYIMFVDGDDWLEIDAIQNLLNGFLNYDADIVQGAVYNVYNERKIVIPLSEEIIKSDIVIEYFKQSKFKTQVWNKLYKTEILKSMSFKEGYNFEDIIFTYQLAKRQPIIVNISSVIYNYLQRTNSIMSQTKLDSKIKVLNSYDLVIQDCQNQNKVYQSLAYFNKYITCLYLYIDVLNKELSYNEANKKQLMEIMKITKKAIHYGDINNCINRKNKFIYLFASISPKLLSKIFTVWRNYSR